MSKNNPPRPPEGKHTNFCHWKTKAEGLETLNARLVEALEVHHKAMTLDSGCNDRCETCALLREAAK